MFMQCPGSACLPSMCVLWSLCLRLVYKNFRQVIRLVRECNKKSPFWMERTSLAGNFKSRGKWGAAAFYESNKFRLFYYFGGGGVTPLTYQFIPYPGNPYWKGGISTVDLLVLTSTNQLLLKLKLCSFFSFFAKQHGLMRRSLVLMWVPSFGYRK